MKALLALRSVGFCVGQRQMCLNVRWVSFFFVFMQQKYLCHSVVCFVFFTMNGNDRGYGHLAVCGSVRCRTATKVKAGAKPPKSNTPANAHRRVLPPSAFVKPQTAIVIVRHFFSLSNHDYVA